MRSPKFPELFDSEKILIRGSSGSLGILATFDDRKLYTPHKITIAIKKSDLPVSFREHREYQSAELKYLLALLNSKLLAFYYQSVFGGFIDVYPNYLKAMPIPEIPKDDQQPLIEKADLMLSANKELYVVTAQFLNLLVNKHQGLKLTEKLSEWSLLSSKDFLKELSKQKIKFPLTEQAEWMVYFEQEKSKANLFRETIDSADKELNKMVYLLYGLTEDEIRIVDDEIRR
jgi:hypothetical protein